MKVVHYLFQCLCQVLVSGDGHVTHDVDPSMLASQQDAMATQQQGHDQELKSLRDALATQQLQHDTEISAFKQEMMDLYDVMINQQKVMVTKQHDAELTSLKYETTIHQENHNNGLH